MTSNVTYVMMYVRDDNGREQNHLLGTLREVYQRPFTVGRDPGCDVIIDHSSVPPRAAEFSGASNHRFVRWPDAEMRERIDGRAVRIGAFHVQLAELIEPRRVALPPAGIVVRFGPRGLGAVGATDIPEDPRATEARRIAGGLRDPKDHIRRLDGASVEWCEERLRIHFAALSWVTSPLPSLSLTRVEYTSSLDDALARWNREWRAAEARPFRHVTWRHVHRVGKWLGELDHVRSSDRYYAESYAHPVTELLPEPFRYTIGSLVAAHLATLDDDVSPARPLANLLARGVYALALPDSAMLLYLASAAERVERSSAPLERDFVDTLADDGVALAYGDYLEERGELARAEAIRARGGPAIGSPVHYAFEDARPLLLLSAREPPEPLETPETHDLVPDTSVPSARLEIDGRMHALGSRTGIALIDGQLVVDPPPGTSGTMLTQAGGALWLSIARDYASVRLNHRILFDRTRQPLFDGDLITLGGERSAVVRL